MRLKSLAIMMVVVFLLPLFAVAATVPPLPKKYTDWQKSKRKVVTDKSSLFYGIHYMYADKKAMQGYKAGNRFAEGSTIIVEFYNIKENPAVDGPKNMVVMMRKDKKKSETGGWLFAGYGADGKPSNLDPVTTCFGCHQKDASQRDFVISTIADYKK